MRFRGLAGIVVLMACPSAEAQRPPDYCFAAPALTRPKLPAVLMDGMGKVNFAITTSSADAQKFFNQGLAQLHSFWFREAERSFLQAAALDPNAAMAYWGIAESAGGDHLPRFQLPARRSPTPRAQEAIAKAVALRVKVSPREQLYIDAVAVRSSLQSYIKAMRKLVSDFPDDLEAKSMLALVLQNGYHPITRAPGPGSGEALTLLKEVLSKDPGNVGALHYIVHAYEGSSDIKSAEPMVKRLAELAFNIPHALHMPGHVYSQTGQLQEATDSFLATEAKEREYMNRDSLHGTIHFAHNEHFLVHVLGLQGRYADAISHANQLLAMKENPRERAQIVGFSAYRQGWFALMRTLVRFEKWDQILDGKTLPLYDKPTESAWYHYARGLAFASKADGDRAMSEYRAMQSSMDKLQESTKSVPIELGVAVAELEGYIGVRAGKVAQGLEVMRQAAEMEDASFYNEPPSYPRPVRELLGRTLLELRDFKSAETVYRALLQKEPGSVRATSGLKKALP